MSSWPKEVLPIRIQVFVQTIVSMLSIFTVVWAVIMRSTAKSRYYLFLALTVFFYATGYLLELDAQTLEAAYFAQRMQYFGVPFVAVCYYLFIRDYGNRPVRKKWQLGLLFLLPVVVLFSMNGYPDWRAYYHRITFDMLPTPHLVIEKGVLFYLFMAYSLGLILLGLIEVLWHYPTTTINDRRQRFYFALVLVLPSIATMLFVVDVLPISMNMGSGVLVLSLLLFGYHLLRYQAQNWLPYAREHIVESMNDGYILLDNDGRYMDANKTALRLFPLLKKAARCTPALEIEEFPPKLLNQTSSICEFPQKADDEERWLRASSTPIFYNGNPVCFCILLYDVTERRKLMAELEASATRDALTGVLNRATLFKLARRDFALARRSGARMSLMMLDIDFFKNVNDQHGHQSGDEVLREIGELLQKRLRRTDIIGRYGGEEFLVALPNTGIEGTFVIASDIRRLVSDCHFSTEDNYFHITISIGLAELDHKKHQTLDKLIAEADNALYEAKNTGRNRVVAYSAGEGGAVALPDTYK